ncbi:MAG: hypothetical protein DRP29_00605 [Thermodesulfobacteriota bacterium]|nr:MAG: hypothetical protein DRP29_00605 [Thermodesulfobacteriota bacterium]
MNTKRKGIEAERRAKKILEQAGYLVIRSSASLGPFDLVAIGTHGTLRLIQVKKGTQATRAEREALAELASKFKNASVEYWFFPEKSKEPVITVF